MHVAYPESTPLSPQDLFVQHEAARILLEAVKHGGHAGLSDLAAIHGFLQSLIDAVSTQVQVRGARPLR